MSFLLRLKSFTLTSPLQNNQKKKTLRVTRVRKNEYYTILWISKQFIHLIIGQTIKRLSRAILGKEECFTIYQLQMAQYSSQDDVYQQYGSKKKKKNVSIVRRRQQLVLAMFFQRRWKATLYVFRNTCGALWSAKETSKTSSCRATRWAIFLSWSLCY